MVVLFSFLLGMKRRGRCLCWEVGSSPGEHRFLSPYWLRYHIYWPSSRTKRSRQVPRLLWSESLIRALIALLWGFVKLTWECQCHHLSRSSSSCLGSSCCCFKRSPGSDEFWSQGPTWHSRPPPPQNSRGKWAAPGSPGLIFPACMISSSAASYCPDREAWLQSESSPHPHECFESKRSEFITST